MTKARYIESPASGRLILVDGSAFNTLLNVGYTRKQLMKDGVVMKPRPKRTIKRPKPMSKSQTDAVEDLPLYDIPSLEKTLSRTKQPALRRRLKEQIARGTSRSSRPAVGWAARAPKKGRPRHRLRDECGDACFLMPENEKFPVCPRCPKNKPCQCELDCGGLLAAKIRARQWGYDNVADFADYLISKRCLK